MRFVGGFLNLALALFWIFSLYFVEKSEMSLSLILMAATIVIAFLCAVADFTNKKLVGPSSKLCFVVGLLWMGISLFAAFNHHQHDSEHERFITNLLSWFLTGAILGGNWVYHQSERII
jgi:hypothetical protein